MSGKQVRCICADNSPFVKDGVYTLSMPQRIDGKWQIEGFAQKWWNEIRFVSIHGIRCLNNGFSLDDGDATHHLVVGRVYKVIKSVGDYYYKLDLPHRPGYVVHENWHHSRFEQVWNPISNKSAKDYDPDEERMWMLMRPHIGPDECVCGIKRIMCDYHRI